MGEGEECSFYCSIVPSLHVVAFFKQPFSLSCVTPHAIIRFWAVGDVSQRRLPADISSFLHEAIAIKPNSTEIARDAVGVRHEKYVRGCESKC